MEMYWKADPHPWGEGKIHALREDDDSKTLCGKSLERCPGGYVSSDNYDCDCRGCAQVMAAAEQRRLREEQWRVRNEERQREWAAEQREWQRKYDAYLQSPEWKKRRAAVLKRANGICESCGEARATEVHHTTYDHVFYEPLYELVAICNPCHERITRMDRGETA